MKKITFSIFLISALIVCENHQSSFPYITGDTFRSYAQYILDNDSSFDPKTVNNKCIVFVKADLLGEFFSRYHPKIKAQYVLITHNSDLEVPGSYSKYLDDPKLLAWFGQNMTSHHAKAIGIPIGFANQCWGHGKFEIYDQIIKRAKNNEYNKNNLLYMNFVIGTFFQERMAVWNLFKDAPFCFVASNRSHKEFLEDMASSFFVLSPRGNGYDCHRTWEALFVGCYPIMQRCAISHLYNELPVIQVDSWNEVTEDFLHNKLAELSSCQYNYEKLYMPYWIKKIQSFLQ